MGGNEGGEYRFTIPVLPPSVNALHNIIYTQRKVVLKPEILKWRSDIACFVPRITLGAESLVAADLIFYYPYLYQNGKLRRFDTHNMVKVLLDVISWKAGFDDSRVKNGSWKSIDSVDEKVEVTLKEWVYVRNQ
jgi:Holliday junction resolvase RusA-like endonuclease